LLRIERIRRFPLLQPELKPLEVPPIGGLPVHGLELDVILVRENVHLDGSAMFAQRRDRVRLGQELAIRHLQQERSGDASGSANPLGLTMDSNKSVTATFVQPPEISLQPTGGVVDVGSSFSFSVGAIGTAPLSYQWLFNGAVLSNATAATLTLSNIQTIQVGDYRALVTSPYGMATSQVATLFVNCPGNQFLAGAALARDEHRRIGPRKLANQFKNLAHRLALTDDLRLQILRLQHGAVLPFKIVARPFTHLASGFQGFENNVLEFWNIERLEQVVVHLRDGQHLAALGAFTGLDEAALYISVVLKRLSHVTRIAR